MAVDAAWEFTRARTSQYREIRSLARKIWEQSPDIDKDRFESDLEDVRFYISRVLNEGSFSDIWHGHEVTYIGYYTEGDERSSILPNGNSFNVPILSCGLETGTMNWLDISDGEIAQIEEFMTRVEKHDKLSSTYFDLRGSFHHGTAEYTELRRIENEVGNFLFHEAVSPRNLVP